MIHRVLSSASFGNEKFRIAEVDDSICVQSQSVEEFDQPSEWSTLFATTRSSDGLKACVGFQGELLLNKKAECGARWEQYR